MNFFGNNELLFFTELILTFSVIALLYQFMGVEGLYLWIPLSIFISNVTVLKQVNLFGLNATLGNITYASSFLVTDLLGEHYHRTYTRRVVAMGFISFTFMIIFTQISLNYTPNDFDTSQKSLEEIFSITPLLLISSLLAFILSQIHDIWAYALWKRILPSRKFLWLRNNASTLVSQLLDTSIFVGIATIFGIFPIEASFEILISTYLLKTFIGICDTPFLYLMSYLHRKREAKKI